MRFYLSHKLPFGFRGTIGFGSFHHTHVLMQPPGSAYREADAHPLFLLCCMIVGAVFAAYVLTH
jgi:hypothetical protein